MHKSDKYKYTSRWDKEFYTEDAQETHARYERERIQRVNQTRLNNAVQKECSGCGQSTWHDPDDYMCIVCRDGPDALPDSTHMHGMTTAV